MNSSTARISQLKPKIIGSARYVQHIDVGVDSNVVLSDAIDAEVYDD